MIHIQSRISRNYFDDYQFFKNGRYQGFCHPVLAEHLSSDSISNIMKKERYLKIIKSKRNIVFNIRNNDSENLPMEWVNIKTEKNISHGKSILSGILGSKARRSFKTACRLISCDLDTPIPLGYIERKKGIRVIENFYLSEAVETEFNIRDYIKKSAEADVKPVIHAVAAYANKLHDAGIIHRDMNITNFLIYQHQGQRHIGMIDLNRAIGTPWLPGFIRIYDISRMNWKKYRGPFFNAYCCNRKSFTRWQWFFDFYIKYLKKRRSLKK